MEKPTFDSDYTAAYILPPVCIYVASATLHLSTVHCCSRSGNTWYVSDILGESTGYLKCPASGSSSLPPEKGWTYYNFQEYLPDPLLSCLPLSSSSPCATITVTARGEAERLHPSCLGTYRSEGQYSCGRQVVSPLSTPGPAVTSVPCLPQAGRREGEVAAGQAGDQWLDHS